MTDYAIGVRLKINQPTRRGRWISKWKRANKHRRLDFAGRRIQGLGEYDIFVFGNGFEKRLRHFWIRAREHYIERDYSCAERRSFADYASSCCVFSLER